MLARHSRFSRSRPRFRGFTLIEVLVSVVVLAIGLLGLARLQVAVLKSSHDAYLLSQATIAANDILERMRANRDAARAGKYNVGIGQKVSGAGVAETDILAWKALLAGGLPSGDGAVNCANGVCTVTVQWTGLKGDDGRGDVQLRFTSEI